MTGVIRAIRTYLITGVLVSLPLVVTVYLLWLGFTTVDNQLGQLVELVFDQRVPGAGAVLTILLLLGVGMFAANVLGRRLIAFGERVLVTIPVVRPIYLSVKQIIDAFTMQRQNGAFRRVVMFEYPRRGVYSVAFVTNDGVGEIQAKSPEHVLTLFVPTAPNPTSGYFLVVPVRDCIPLDMSVEEAFKMIISGGALIPPWRSAAGNGPTPAASARVEAPSE